MNAIKQIELRHYVLDKCNFETYLNIGVHINQKYNYILIIMPKELINKKGYLSTKQKQSVYVPYNIIHNNKKYKLEVNN